jgi:hypothetical protein
MVGGPGTDRVGREVPVLGTDDRLGHSGLLPGACC